MQNCAERGKADTCRILITSKLQSAGWDSDPHSITEQRIFADGRIVVHGITSASSASRAIAFSVFILLLQCTNNLLYIKC